MRKVKLKPVPPSPSQPTFGVVIYPAKGAVDVKKPSPPKRGGRA